MQVLDLTFSIVIVGNSHNPTIFTPDFLSQNDIVPKDWEINKQAPFLVSPLNTVFSYNTGISIQVNPTTLIINDAAPDGDIFPVPEIAKKIIKALPHVNYTAIGINIEKAKVFDDMEKAQSFSLNYLNLDKTNYNNKLVTSEYKLIYKFDDAYCNYSISQPQQFIRGSETYIAISSKGNFHRDLTEFKNNSERNNKIQEIINNYKNDQENYTKLYKMIFGE